MKRFRYVVQLVLAMVVTQAAPSSAVPSITSHDDSQFYKTCAMQFVKYHSENHQANAPARERVFSLDELLDRTRQQNFDVRLNAERVFQARERIKVSVGKIIPHLNFNSLIAILDNYYEVAASILGFVYPSHWFQWRESKLYFEAERCSHAALVANQINMVASSFYEISYMKHLQVSYQATMARLGRLIDIAAARARLGEDRIDRVLKLQNTKDMLEQDYRTIDNELRQLYYNLAYALGDPVETWNEFEIETIALPKLNKVAERQASELLGSVTQHSFEIEEYKYLGLAARYATKARRFDFLSPTGDDDSALGFGYLSHIRIGRSQAAEMELKRQRLEEQLSLAVYKAVEDHNYALASYRKARQGLKRSMALHQFLIKKFEEGGEYDADEFVEASNAIFAFESQVLSAQHKYLISQALIERLDLQGTHYAGLLELSPAAPRYSLGLRQRLENSRIARALRKGEIDLPEPVGT